MSDLENARWSPKWVSHLGCIKGCLDYLKLEVSDVWLFGATGHAFVINIHPEVCPSGPTAWKTVKLFELGRNIGYAVDGVFGLKAAGDFAALQKRAWDFARGAIDQGLPCYGWELEIPEFYVVYGYDEVGYYYSGPQCDDGKGPKAWQELGETDIGVIEMYSVAPGQSAAAAQIVEEAFSFVIEHATSPEKWIYPPYKAGLDGFDSWIDALAGGKAADLGVRYNAAVWAECRRYAVEFLQEVQLRIDGGIGRLLDTAIGRYQVVAKSLDQVAQAYPFSPGATMAPLPVDERSRAALKALKAAREAEAAGLEMLANIVSKLSSS